MRAAAAAELASPAREVAFEPKWDGFRALAWTGRNGAELQSRHGNSLTRYFPDVCRALAEHLPAGLVLDGELVSWDQARGRTSFDQLRRRITAGRGVAREAALRPAHFVAFDLLQDTRDRELLDQPLSRRRRRLERLLSSAPPQLPICPQTADEDVARAWFADWSPTGIEGLVVKETRSVYRPGQIGWAKVKARDTDEFVIGGVTGGLAEPNSLLLGRFDDRGVLRFITLTQPLRATQRRELAGLQAMVFRGAGSGHPWPCPLPAGWSFGLTDRKPLLYSPVEPTVVAEIETDVAADGPFGRRRHVSKLVRVRPDLHPDDVARV
jgi:ATP-dependent DNA ligase